jgi:hypothetical protein
MYYAKHYGVEVLRELMVEEIRFGAGESRQFTGTTFSYRPFRKRMSQPRSLAVALALAGSVINSAAQ